MNDLVARVAGRHLVAEGYDGAAVVVRDDQGRVLLLRRGDSAPWMPGKWNLPGGTIEGDETPEAAARREVKEEAHIEIGDIEKIEDREYSEGVTRFYRAKSFKGKPRINWEHDRGMWVAPENIGKFDVVPGVDEIVAKVVGRAKEAAQEFSVGDSVLFGKYKNKRGKVLRFFEDERGVPSVEIEPVPKGRKHNVKMGLYKIWQAKTATEHAGDLFISTGGPNLLPVEVVGREAQAVTVRDVSLAAVLEGRESLHTVRPEDLRTASSFKEACIVFSKKCDGDVILGKVRDRMYDPEVCIYHMEVDGTEMCVMFDRITGFCEGVNEHGIGIVNSTLMVLQDEREGVADGDNEPERSPDGVKIIKALTFDKIGDVLQSLILHKPEKFKRGLKGHTLVSDGNKVYALENTRIHAPKSMKLDADRVHTRTNHGIYYPGAGYTKGADYISSIVRRWEAQKQLEKAQHAEDLMPALTQAIEKVPSALNPTRFTDKMRTTSQMTVDPKNREVRLYLVPEHSKFKGIRNLLPGGRAPKIKAKVYKYPGKDKLQDSSITVPEEMSMDSARREKADPAGMTERVAARYKSKKKVKTKDGDEMTVYEYSDRQVADRNRGKAERIEKLRKSMKKLQSKVRKDVQSKNEKTRDVALAVGLMDETFERVGNPGSAKEGHFGVTTWRVKHIKFGKGSATISYVGKSGVDQKKKVTNARIVGALRKVCKDKGPDDCVLSVSAADVNKYLKGLGITAKDIRGFHANTAMKEELRKVRKGKLPADPKEKAKRLKDEFKKALEATAERVGHEPSTLKSQYLVPGVEDDFLRDGTVNESHTKKGSILRMAAEHGTPTERRILANAVNAAVLVARERSWWLREAPNLYRIARDQERPRPDVDGIRFPPEMFSVLWYEDGDGHRLDWDADGDGIPDRVQNPDGAKYQLSNFPNVLHDSMLELNDDGTSTEIMRGSRGYPDDLVTEMVRSGDWDVGDAIMVAAQSCERCLNTLTFRYQQDDGYEFESPKYWECGTRCKMCDHVDNAPEDMHREATKSDAEVEEEGVQKMLRPEPKQKPPRYDLRDNRTLDEDDEEILGGGDGGDRDLSMKWNKVARRVAFQWVALPRGISGARVALWHVADAGPRAPKDGEKPSFEEWVKDQKWPSKAENAEPGAEIGFEGLKKQDPSAAAKVREEYKQKYGVKDEGAGKKDKSGDEDEERPQEEIGKDLEEARNSVVTLKEEAKELKKTVQEHEKNLDQLKESLGEDASTSEEKKEKLQARIDEVKDSAREGAARMKSLGGDLDSLRGKAGEIKKTIDEHQSNLDRLEEQAGQPRPKSGEKKEKIEGQLNEVKEKIEKGKVEAKGLDSELDGLEEELDELDATRGETKKLVGDILKCTRNLNPDHPNVKKMKEKAREGRREFRQLESKIKDQKTEISTRKKRLDEIKQQGKAGEDLIGKLETALKEPDDDKAPASPDEIRGQIKEERKKLREAEQQAEDVTDEIKGKKTEHKKLRQQAKSEEALVEKMEKAVGEVGDGTPTDPDEVKAKIKEETAKLREAEDAFDEKVGDLKAQNKVVDDLKAERADPSGAKRKKQDEAKKKHRVAVQKALLAADKTVQKLLGKGSVLPKQVKAQISAQMDSLSDKELEVFSLGLQDNLQKMISLPHGSEEGAHLANSAARMGFSTEGLTDPKEIAQRVAQIVYTREVAANPMISGGKPLGVTDMGDSAAYGERAKASFEQFQNLHPTLRVEAGKKLQAQLKGLSEKDPRADEIKALLVGIDTAHIAQTGEALPGRQQPSKGAAALIKRMVETGGADQMFGPVDDMFADDSRKAMRRALETMDRQEAADWLIGDDPNHPFAGLKDQVQGGHGADEYSEFIQRFLIDDFMADVWADRATRDIMEAAGTENWDDPEVRAKILEQSKHQTAPAREAVAAAMGRVRQAQSDGVAPDSKDVAAVEAMYGPEKSGGLVGNVRALFQSLQDKFKGKKVVSPAIAVLENFAETGDKSVLEGETLPHVDANIPMPRTKAQRKRDLQKAQEDTLTKLDEERGPTESAEAGKAQRKKNLQRDMLKKLEEKYGPTESAGGEGASEKKPQTRDEADDSEETETSKEETQRRQEKLKALRQKLKDQRSKASPEQRKKLVRLKALRQKLKAQRSGISPAQRERVQAQMARVEKQLLDAKSGKPDDEAEAAVDEKHKPGDVWQTESGQWAAKRKDGETDTFDSREKADAYIKGKVPTDPDEFSADFKVPVEERGPSRFATERIAATWLAKHRPERLANNWLAHVRSFHPDDPNRPLVLLEAA